MRMSSRRRIYEEGMMLRALQILESNNKLRWRNLTSRYDRVRTYVRRPKLPRYTTRSTVYSLGRENR